MDALFGRTRVALLLFVALNGALLLGSIFAEVRRRTSIAAALLSVAMLMMCSAFYPVLLGVRSDLLLALLIFWATVHGGEWMHSHSQKSRHRFCAFAALALLVHGRAAVLLFLPFLLLFAFPPRTPWKWVVAGLVLLLALQLPHVFSVSNPFRLRTAAFDAWMYLLGTERLATWPAILLALAGSPLVFKNGPTRPFWAAVASLAAAGFIFYVLVPVYWDGRYLLPTVTAVAVLAGGGVQVLLDALAKHGSPQRRWLIAAVTVAAVVVIGRAAYFSPAKPDLGYRKMMANCLLCGHSVGLVAGDATQEGDLIAEAALSDPTLSRTMLRASKVLAKSTWSGYDYRTLYSSPAQVLDYLDRAKVSIIVIHNASTRDDVSELRSALALSGPNWVSDDRTYAAQKVTVFRRPTQPGAAAH